MSLVFAESFDSGYGSNLLSSGRYVSATSNFSGTISATHGRNGNGWGMDVYTGSLATLYRLLAPAEQDDLLVVGMAHYFTSYGSSSYNHQLLYLNGDATTTSAGTTHLTFYWNAASRTIDVYRGNVSTFLGSSSVIPTSQMGTWIYLEFKARLHDSSGTAEIRLNGVSIFSFGGDTKNAGTAAVFNMVGIGNWNYSGSGYCRIDDIYVCNEQGSTNNDYLGDIRVEALLPNGDGAHSDLTTSNYNRLPSLNISGIETDATGWVADTNCAIARVTTPVHSGLGSTGALRVTASGAGNMIVKSAIGTAGAPVRSGQQYFPAIYAQANSTGRNLELGIDWYDSTGAYLSRSTMTSTSADASTGYVQKGGVLVTAPTNAAFASLVVQIDSAANGEIHFLDDGYISESAALADPGANGGQTTHYTTVNDLTTAATTPDLSYLIGSTDDLVDTWTFTDPVSPSGKAVKGAVVFAQAKADTFSSKSLALVARNAGGTESTSADQALGQAWPGGVSAGFDTEPSGSAWTVSSLTSAQFGVKVRP